MAVLVRYSLCPLLLALSEGVVGWRLLNLMPLLLLLLFVPLRVLLLLLLLLILSSVVHPGRY